MGKQAAHPLRPVAKVMAGLMCPPDVCCVAYTAQRHRG